MKKKMLAAAIASVLAVPSAFAAIDDAGMKYTSAAEGFYGSLRFALQSGEDNDANIGHESSRIGIQGDVDIGHGNTAFYRAEWRVRYTRGPGSEGAGDDGTAGPFHTRLTYIGMRGAYGSVRFGQIWSADYDYVTSLTDVTNNVTGNLAPRFRVGNALRYDSPDIQGFNFSIQLHADDNNGRTTGGDAFTDAQFGVNYSPRTLIPDPDGAGPLTETAGFDADNIGEYNALTAVQRARFRDVLGLEEVVTDEREDTTAGQIISTVTGLRTPEVTDSDDGNEFDRYILAASYGIRGVKLAATYVNNQSPDGSDAEDETSWGIGGNYGQDNWKVGYLYWDTSDYRGGDGDDLTGHSFSGQVSFDKVTLRAVFDTQEFEAGNGPSGDTDAFTLEAQYSFSSKARAYATYQNVDREAGGAGFFGAAGRQSEDDSDTFYVAYRVDF